MYNSIIYIIKLKINLTLSYFILNISIINPSKYNKAFLVIYLSAALLNA